MNSAPLIKINYLHYGFTLLEILISLAIMAILTVMAGPSLQSFVKNSNKIKKILVVKVLVIAFTKCKKI